MNPIHTITQFVLERIHDEPIHRQIPLYRALAEITVDAATAASLKEEANALENANDRQRHLRLVVMARGAYTSKAEPRARRVING